ncbi:MFS transporter [Acidilobus saccharovorans]|uniref:MFS transporter n=1 Tax=Acidilobus saccharovorans TaxID=242703 RepID=UPI0011D176AB|nr:MFS transporter [Acidilobus saccharovorans]
MPEDLGGLIDRARWGRAHTLIFASTAIGFFIWGIINALAFSVYPSYNNVYYIVVVAAAPLLGDLLLPWISDQSLGRKNMYIITMSLYGIGSAVIVLDLLLLKPGLRQMVIFLAAYALSMIGVEGEVPVGLALLAEIMPVKWRQKSLILSPNFENIGAAAGAAAIYLTYFLGPHAPVVDAISIVGIAVGGLVAAIVIRLMMPESIRWLTARGLANVAEREVKKVNFTEDPGVKVEEVNNRLGVKSRFLVLTSWSIANYLTWSLMAFVLADYYFKPPQLYLVMFYANLGAAAAGLVVPLFIEKINTRSYSLLSFALASLSFIPVLLYVALGLDNATIFYALTFTNLFFITFTWFARTIYEPLLFPTERRAFMVGSVRAVAMSAFTASTYVTYNFSELDFALYGLIMELVGLAGALWWAFKGYDVRMKSTDSLSAIPSRPSYRPLS